MSNNILRIKFNASTVKGIIGKDITYKPAMSNPSLYSQFPDILFIPSIRLEKNMFDKDLGDDDIKKIFLSPSQFDNFITRILEKKQYKPITLTQAKNKGIIYNNIKFILGLFFSKDNKLFLDSKSFIINNYNWNNKYNLINLPNRKAPIIEIKLTFVVHMGESLSFIDSTKLNCIQKKEKIINDYYSLVGIDINSEKTAKSKYQIDGKPRTKKNKTQKKKTGQKPKKVVTTTYYGGYTRKCV
jgi:hypothetical protein